MSEDSPPPVTRDTPAGPDVDLGRDGVSPADDARLTDTIVGHLADQVRCTASAAKAGRVVNADGEPGVLDLTPLRELLSELMGEVRKLRPRGRIVSAPRQPAGIINPRTPSH